jgi:hypothetical protein
MAPHAKVPGNRLCLDSHAQRLSSTPIADQHGTYGTLDFWWSPLCQTHFAYLANTGDLQAQLLVDLEVIHVQQGAGTWAKQTTYKTSYSLGPLTQGSVWSIMLWGPKLAVSACGNIWLMKGSNMSAYGTCSAAYVADQLA